MVVGRLANVPDWTWMLGSPSCAFSAARSTLSFPRTTFASTPAPDSTGLENVSVWWVPTSAMRYHSMMTIPAPRTPPVVNGSDALGPPPPPPAPYKPPGPPSTAPTPPAPPVPLTPRSTVRLAPLPPADTVPLLPVEPVTLNRTLHSPLLVSPPPAPPAPGVVNAAPEPGIPPLADTESPEESWETVQYMLVIVIENVEPDTAREAYTAPPAPPPPPPAPPAPAPPSPPGPTAVT